MLPLLKYSSILIVKYKRSYITSLRYFVYIAFNVTRIRTFWGKKKMSNKKLLNEWEDKWMVKYVCFTTEKKCFLSFIGNWNPMKYIGSQPTFLLTPSGKPKDKQYITSTWRSFELPVIFYFIWPLLKQITTTKYPHITLAQLLINLIEYKKCNIIGHIYNRKYL